LKVGSAYVLTVVHDKMVNKFFMAATLDITRHMKKWMDFFLLSTILIYSQSGSRISTDLTGSQLKTP